MPWIDKKEEKKRQVLGLARMAVLPNPHLRLAVVFKLKNEITFKFVCRVVPDKSENASSPEKLVRDCALYETVILPKLHSSRDR